MQAAWQVTNKIQAHAGGGIMVIPPNIWQDNFLTGSTPFVVYPRVVATQSAPISYGFQITPAQLPRVYTPSGQDVFAKWTPTQIPSNTVMDVDRYEKDLAALTPSVRRAQPERHRRELRQRHAVHVDAGTGAQIRQPDGRCGLRGHGRAASAALQFPQCISRSVAGLRAAHRVRQNGNVIGGFGVENVVHVNAHSTYHALQTSLSGTVGHGGPGIQASYTWSKSIDDTSMVIGGTGSTGAVASGTAQNPFDAHPEKGPSTFDVTHGFGLSVAQDLHLE